MNPPIFCLTEVEWREVGEDLTAEIIWPRNQTCPCESEVRWCQVHLETNEQLNVGDRRWLLYQMGNSLVNGADSPEELDALSLVEAEVLAVESGIPGPFFFSQYSQWWQVKCVQVIPLASIPQRLPLIPAIDIENSRPPEKPACVSDRLFLYASGGQVVETQIYAGENSVPTHLVFYQISISNKCEIYNWPIKQKARLV